MKKPLPWNNHTFFALPMRPTHQGADMSRRYFAPLCKVIILVLLSLTYGCDLNKPILVGFAGQLTGVHSNMGVQGRDGVQLALDKLNATGGIGGRPVKLLVRDDKGTSEGAGAADRALIDAGVAAIIGHMTSGQTSAALPIAEKAGVVLVSPTTSTPDLSGIADHFFRVTHDSSKEARLKARLIFQRHGHARLAAIYDSANAPYTKAYLDVFSQELQKAGGRMVGTATYSSGETADFRALVMQLSKGDPQGILILASSYDTAFIAQQTRLLGWQIPLYGCGWASSDLLIENGGKSVEGMEFLRDYDTNSQAAGFKDFQKRYQDRFKQKPDFMASKAYEAMLVLAAAMEKTGGRRQGMCDALSGIEVEGLSDVISLDRYGDVVRPYFLVVVEDGQFVTKESLDQ